MRYDTTKQCRKMTCLFLLLIFLFAITAFAKEDNVSDTVMLTVIENAQQGMELIRVLDKNDSWNYGSLNPQMETISNNGSYITLGQRVAVQEGDYKVTVNNSSYRMIFYKYDENGTYLGNVDLCDGDIISADSTMKYAAISAYQYKNRQFIETTAVQKAADLDEGLSFQILPVDLTVIESDDARVTAEIHPKSLENYGNYRKGAYKSYGGAYEYATDALCTRNFYRVDAEPYMVNINDSQIIISISEYDDTGKWIKYTSSLKNGSIFQKQAATTCIGFHVKSTKWGVNLDELFQNGLIIDLASSLYLDGTATMDLEDVNLADIDSWRTGYYLYETGDFVIGANKICSRTFLNVISQPYVVRLPGGYLRMEILELKEDGSVVCTNTLQSGQKWTKQEDTKKIAITVTGYNKTFVYADYRQMIEGYSDFGLELYQKYVHNTVMRNMTAGEMINTINVGWNLGNSLDSKSSEEKRPNNLQQETSWNNPYVTKDLIQRVKEAGFNTIRIPVTWYYNTYVDETGHLKITEAWLDRVQDVVNYAIEQGLYVILNAHHEQPIIYAGVEEEEMVQVLQNAVDLWTGIAARFQTYDEHLMFESYNEVDNLELSWNFGETAAQQVNELNKVFVQTVRASGGNNVNRILIVPTLLDGCGTRFYQAFEMPEDSVERKIIVQVHTYSKKYNQDIEQDFEELEAFSQRINAPIIIGEFGTQDTYPISGLREEHVANFVARAAAHGIKCVWWDNGTNYCIFDRKSENVADLGLIQGMLQGVSEGIAYQNTNELVFDDYDEKFVLKMPNLTTGVLEDVAEGKDPEQDFWWRTITTDLNGQGIPVAPGAWCSFSLKAINNASDIYLQRALFYDAQGELITIYNENGTRLYPFEIRDSGFTRYYICQVPEGAATMRISVNNPYNWTKLKGADYETYLANGDLCLWICVNAMDIASTQVAVKNFEYQKENDLPVDTQGEE